MRKLATLAVLVASLAGVVWARAHTGPRLHVGYYYIPYCLSCARVRSSLASFKRDFGPRVDVREVDCFSDEGVAAAKKYGFVTHGIVVEDREHTLLFEEKDHGVSADDVRVVVEQELAKN